MKLLTLSFLIFVSVLANKSVFAQYQQQQYGGRVAPGVPPQHYQAPQDVNTQNQQQQQYQQQQNQNAQIHQQQQAQLQAQQQAQQQAQLQAQQQAQLQAQQQAQQQAELLAQQQAQQMRQSPPGRPTAPIVGSGHVHLKPHDAVFDTSNIEMEREHLQEHMDVPIDTSQMSEDELMFHNFKMWDGDKDNLVDGLDLLKYLMQHLGGEDPSAATQYTDDQYADIVDTILNTMDGNKDGIMSFTEYRQSSKAHRQSR